ncbi:unnamed protein product [Effrenium voratum]|uniref:PX domain-containing protein n=1 Tax=Effrenium voratum TaxID=2562239 RepID=A0AA36HUI3_9DINO|nr:unnamed protein product [Effrenium voratum]CAJ1374872.1 unnamed protein product [Effrenium voratum]CAJ1435284.1 unnamed protein product [Effrenium voratum]
MTTLADLSVSVYKAGPTYDHTTYQYHIQLKFGGKSWDVAKRFSEFDSLLQSLANGRYGGLPKLPAKTLLGSPTDQAAIDARKEQLRIVLQDLLLRPDTRTSAAMRHFLDIPDHVDEEIRQIQPSPIRSFEDPRFGVSGICVAQDANLVLVTHEDSTHLSRLGRVWSVVEPDELGALHMWARDREEGSWRRGYSQTYGIKVRSLCWEGVTRQIFVGLEDGKIEVFLLKPGEVKPEAIGSLELHHKSPVTHLSVSSRKLLSVGFDTAMRVIDVRSKELLCGGRLQKRLRSEMDYLSSCYLDDVHDRAFITTSGGDLFVLDISQNPPNFLHTVDMTSSPVSDVTLTQEHLLVAHCDCVSALTLHSRGEESEMTRLGSYRAKHLHQSEVNILSVAAAVERDLIFGGYSDGSIAIWCMRETEAVLVLQGHQCDVTKLVWVEELPWGPVLYSGGGDGKVTSWNLNGNAEDFALWEPMSGLNMLDRPAPLAATAQGSDDALSAFEPNFEATPQLAVGGYSDPFAIGGIGESRRVNPQALKTEDSDSDNELVDAFH